MARNSSKADLWQKLMPLTIAVIAFTGSSLGTIYPRWAFPAEETQKRLLDSRISAYNDFFKGQVKKLEAERLREGDLVDKASQAEEEYSSLVTDARFRIAVYGTKAEITAIVNYFRNNSKVLACRDSRSKWNDDVRIYQGIRNGVFRNDDDERVDDDSLILLLFNCRAPDETSQ